METEQTTITPSDFSPLLDNQVQTTEAPTPKQAEPSKPALVLKDVEKNVFAALNVARVAAEKHGLDWVKIRDEATGDYDHLLEVLSRHFEVV